MKKATTSETPSAKSPAKKVSAKAAPAPAPASAPIAAPAPKPAVTPIATPAPKPAVAEVAAPVSKPAPAPKPAAKKEVAKKPAAPAANGLTAIVAKVDVGFGNLLFVRGDGPGLSWDRGVPMDCAASDQWTWSTTTATRPFAYKVLINDERWSAGDDYVAEVGVENTISPVL